MALAQVPSKSLDFHPPRRLAAQPKAPNCSRPQPRSSGLGQRGGRGRGVAGEGRKGGYEDLRQCRSGRSLNAG